MANLVGENNELFPLSLNQRNIWDLERVLSGTSINTISTTVSAKGRADVYLLEKALNIVLSTDMSLRTRITMDGAVPMQYHADYEEERFPFYDFSASDETGVRHWEEAVTREPMPVCDSPLYRFILFRTNDGTISVLVKTHHIISDGWTQVALLRRISQVYHDLVCGREPSFEDAPSYKQFVEDEQKYLGSDMYRKDREYWQNLLNKQSEPASIKSLKSGALSHVGKRKSFMLPEKLNNLIYIYCTEKRVAPFIVFYMALALYLKKAGGSGRFTLGVPVFNRASNLFKKTTGMFVSTIPFIGEISELWSFNEFGERIEENWLELLRHQRFPFSHMRELQNSDSPLFNIMLSYQDNKIYKSDDEIVSFSGRWHYSGFQAEQLCIHLLSVEENRKYSAQYDYLTQIFSESEIETLHKSLCNILLDALAVPDAPIHNHNLLDGTDFERVVYAFNESSKPISENSLFELLKRNAIEAPDRAAVIYKGRRLTYRELLNEGGRVAAALPNRGVLAAVMLPRTPQLLIAMAGIMQAGCAWVIIPTDTPHGRITEILSQSGAGALITTSDVSSGIPSSEIPVIDMNALPPTTEEAALVSGESLAYVVYTSGSTGKPKGVEITQRNLINLTLGMRPLYSKGAVISLCNIGFDAFILESAAALLCGRTIIFPQDFELESPADIAGLISSYSAGFMGITPSRLSAYLKNPQFAAALRGFETIICGGEAFSPDLLQNLRQLTEAKIINQYGPSETTVAVSYSVLSDTDRITIGKPMPNCRLYVLDEWRRPLPVGVYGNLYVGGASVGRGYRNAPSLTAESFFENPFIKGEIIYKTGDIAAWTESGELLISGRLDRQVKLRGLRIEPQEVSACISRHPSVTDAASKVISRSRQQLLVVYFTSENPVPETELMAFAAEYLPRYMIPARIIRLDKLPLTANGKIDEAALPEPTADDAPIKASGAFQELLLGIFRRVLGNDSIHAGSDYFLCGGNSLNAMEALGEIEETTGIRLRISDFYACRTVRKIDEYLSSKSGEAAVPVAFTKAGRRDKYPISPMQSNIYVQSFMDSGRLAYNMPGAFKLGFTPDIARLENAFKLLIDGDDCFRTSFVQNKGEISAVISDSVPFTLSVLHGSREEVFAEFLKPFELSKAPLLRAALWEEEKDSFVLLVDSHHIIGDGVSTPIIIERLSKLYSGETVEVPYSYKDYVCDMEIRREDCSGEQGYWKNTLLPLPEGLDLPLDAPRPSVFDYKGAHLAFDVSPELTRSADEYCEKLGVTSFMLYLGVFGILVSKITGQNDFIVGTPVAGRLRPELQKICGLFMNTLPIRLRPEGELENYFRSIKDSVLGMLDNQKLPLESIISMLNLPRTLSQNPLYQLLFSFRPIDAGAFELGGHKLEYVPIPTGSTKLDLSIEAAREGESLSFNVEYATSLFSRETIDLYGRSFVKLISEVLENDNRTIEEISAVSDEDKRVLFDEPNSSRIPYPNKTLNQIFAEQAKENPDKTAVIWHDSKITFSELNKRADEIASLLISKGVKRGDRVGLLCRRTPDLLASMLGILKAGAAYLPVLTDYPTSRISYMLSNAEAKLLLSDPISLAMLDGALPCPVALTDESTPHAELIGAQEPSDPIYVLYTSGSTGQPKGAQLPHRAITNLLEAIKGVMNGNEGPVLCTSNVTFDIFITESLLALAQGFAVVLADDEEMMLPWKIAELVSKHNPKMMQFTPSRMLMVLGNDAFKSTISNVEMAIVAGEMVTPRLVEKFKKHCQGRLINMYGPTEAAVYVAYAELFENTPVAIGRPVNNCRIYILDENKAPVMPTARGEIYIAGDCLADGYISRPDLTESLFLPDPFFPGQKMYKSGDIGRIRADGVIECLGRKDSQIKINGIRVELDEITSAMTKAGALEAATIAQKNPDDSTSLFGFVTPRELDINLLKTKLGSILPPYMIPSQIMALDALPHNASGKTDIQALKKLINEPSAVSPQFETLSSCAQPTKAEELLSVGETAGSSVKPEVTHGSALETILEIWSDTLGTGVIETETSFFEQGGSSLGALNILSQYFNRGLIMTLEQFYKNPSPIKQAELLGTQMNLSENPPLESTSEIRKPVPEKIILSPSEAVFPAKVPAPSKPIFIGLAERVLLTGTTGFLGAHLLRALLERGVYKVACLLRDGDKSRLCNMLSWYFGESWTKRNAAFIEAVKGDITKPMLGIDTEVYARLSGNFRAIYHAAADVRHFTNGSCSEDTNLIGTENAIELALKERVPLIHISTASISGDYVREDAQRQVVFTENDFNIGQNFEDNIYVKTKFLAENAVYSAMERGLDARVFRVGRLVGRCSDGVFQKNAETNAFYNLVQSIGKLGVLPREMALEPLEITPVDVCADAILALETAPLTTYHIIQPNPSPFGEIIKGMFSSLRIVDEESFEKILAQRAADGDAEALAPLIETCNRVKSTPSSIKITAEETHRYLREAGFVWPETSLVYPQRD